MFLSAGSDENCWRRDGWIDRGCMTVTTFHYPGMPAPARARAVPGHALTLSCTSNAGGWNFVGGWNWKSNAFIVGDFNGDFKVCHLSELGH